MDFSKFVDWLAPIAALLLAREHVATLEAALERGKTRLENIRAKLESFFGRDLLIRLRAARNTQMVLEGVILALAFATWVFGISGYCGPFQVPTLYLSALVPALAMLAWSAWGSFQDRTVRSVPLRLFDGEVHEEDVWRGLRLRLVHVDALRTTGTAILDPSVEADQATLAQIIERIGGPVTRSPKAYAYELVFGPLVTCTSLLLFVVLIGQHGLFSLNGVRHAWLVAIGSLPILAAMLSGAGYKLAVGVARAIALVLVDGSADILTSVVRLIATSVPGITEENVEKKVSPITGETVKALANLTEGVENRPIAALFSLVVIGSLFPHPLVVLGLLGAGFITQMRFGNLEANEDADAKKIRLAEVKKLDTKLQWATTLVVVLVIGASLFRGMLVYLAQLAVEIVNLFMRLGVPSSVTPSGWDWAGAIAVGILVMLIAVAFGFGALAAKSLGKGSKAVIALLATAVVLVIAGNWQRRAAYIIRPEWVAAQVGCPVGPGDVAPTTEASSPLIPPLSAAPSTPVAAAPPVAPPAPVAQERRDPATRPSRATRSRQGRSANGGASSRSAGTVSSWTTEECATLPAGTPGCP
ncbi:hypothetical protein KBD13_03150 [Patescibacteria group bacterium]|nr:hypothetical protein [Patescibacteria group bacterium]